VARAGLAEVLPDRIRIEPGPAGTDADIADYLRATLRRHALGSLPIGAPRAHPKPVPQAPTPGGGPPGFVQGGANPPTRRPPRAEAGALAFLASVPLSRLEPPRLLHHGQWQGNEVLVQQAFPAGHPAKSQAELGGAMAELAGVRGLSRQPLADS